MRSAQRPEAIQPVFVLAVGCEAQLGFSGLHLRAQISGLRSDGLRNFVDVLSDDLSVHRFAANVSALLHWRSGCSENRSLRGTFKLSLGDYSALGQAILQHRLQQLLILYAQIPTTLIQRNVVNLKLGQLLQRAPRSETLFAAATAHVLRRWRRHGLLLGAQLRGASLHLFHDLLQGLSERAVIAWQAEQRSQLLALAHGLRRMLLSVISMLCSAGGIIACILHDTLEVLDLALQPLQLAVRNNDTVLTLALLRTHTEALQLHDFRSCRVVCKLLPNSSLRCCRSPCPRRGCCRRDPSAASNRAAGAALQNGGSRSRRIVAFLDRLSKLPALFFELTQLGRIAVSLQFQRPQGLAQNEALCLQTAVLAAGDRLVVGIHRPTAFQQGRVVLPSIYARELPEAMKLETVCHVERFEECGVQHYHSQIKLFAMRRRCPEIHTAAAGGCTSSFRVGTTAAAAARTSLTCHSGVVTSTFTAAVQDAQQLQTHRQVVLCSLHRSGACDTEWLLGGARPLLIGLPIALPAAAAGCHRRQQRAKLRPQLAKAGWNNGRKKSGRLRRQCQRHGLSPQLRSVPVRGPGLVPSKQRPKAAVWGAQQLGGTHTLGATPSAHGSRTHKLTDCQRGGGQSGARLGQTT